MSEPEIRKCPNHIRGCRNILAPDYNRKRCAECLEKEREREKKRREAAKNQQASDDKHKICTTCCQEYPIEDFYGIRFEGEITKTCKACRDNNKQQDERRDREHRNALDRIASKKPERIATKKAWEENNAEKRAEYWQKTRQRYIETDVDGYLRRNAENQKQWRENNPEKAKKMSEDRKNSLNIAFTNYQKRAFEFNLEFNLTVEQFEKLCTSPCYYCGQFSENKEINGIDRTDSSKNYDLDNCVSCCSFCNYLKNTLSVSTFLKRIAHILSNMALISEDKCFPTCFNNYKGSSFKHYSDRANKKELAFELNKTQFEQLCSGNCYICGKPCTENHRNGIDRFNNNLGYNLENTRSCCADCNFMKKHYEYNTFIQKLLKIYEVHKSNPILEEEAETTKALAKTNKKPEEEMKVHKSQQKETRMDKLKLKYSDENIKQNAVKLAKARRKQKTNLEAELKNEVIIPSNKTA